MKRKLGTVYLIFTGNLALDVVPPAGRDGVLRSGYNDMFARKQAPHPQ